MMPRYKLIGCRVLADETIRLADRLGLAASIDFDWLDSGWHNHPDRLRDELARRIAAAGHGYAAILLQFGLCGRATDGLAAPAHCPLVIPRVHDCVALHLGSAGAAARESAREPGTYWFSRGFLEGCRTPDDVRRRMGGGSNEELAALRREFGDKAAAHLYQTLRQDWHRGYRRAVFVRDDGNPDGPDQEALVRAVAAGYGWRVEIFPLDTRLLHTLLTGRWNDSVVIARPGQRLAATGEATALRAEDVTAR